MAKGYWVVFADVTDLEDYNEYVAGNGPALAKYGARFLARGGQVEPKEEQPKSRVVVVEFPSYRAALDCYHSAEYSAAMKLRQGRSIWDVAITEGYEGPQRHQGDLGFPTKQSGNTNPGWPRERMAR